MGLYDSLYGKQYSDLTTTEDQSAAKRKAMMAITAQLLQAGGPSRLPISTGQAIGSALQAGGQAQDQSYQDSLRAALLRKQLQPMAPEPEDVIAVIDPVTGRPTYRRKSEVPGMTPYDKPTNTAQGPSNIQEWEYYNKLSPDDQKRYLEMKRNTQALQMVEYNGGKGILNKATGDLKPVTTADTEAAAASQIAGATETGKATAQNRVNAQADLPRIEQNTASALDTLKKLKEHPGLAYITGLYSKAPVVPGTKQAGADALAKQVEGKTFLEAFTTLRGGGQITEVEGAKATAAIGRLQRSQSTEDYKAALDELSAIMSKGLERAKKKAAGTTDSNVIDFGDLP